MISSPDLQKLIILPSGDFDQHSSEVEYVIQLIRLGSQGREAGNDSCILPSPTGVSSSFVTAREELSAMPGKIDGSKSLTASFVKSGDDGGKLSISGVSRSLSHLSPSPYLLDSKHHQHFDESFAILEGRSLDTHRTGNPTGSTDSYHSPTASFEATGEQSDSKSTTSGQTITVEVELHGAEPEQFPLSMTNPMDLLGLGAMAMESGCPAAATTGQGCEPTREGRGGASLYLSLPPRSPLPPSTAKEHDSSSEDGFCPTLSHMATSSTTTAGILSPEYVRELERNFIENHHFGEAPELPLVESVTATVTRGQVGSMFNSLSMLGAL